MGAYQAAYHGGAADAFFAVLLPDGSDLSCATLLGGAGLDDAAAIALDPAGRAVVVGETTSADFPTRGAAQATLGGGSDAFVAVVDPALQGDASLAGSSFLGGAGADRATSVAVDQTSGTACVVGATGAAAGFPITADAFQPAYGGGASDGFVARVDPSQSGATAPVTSSFLGGAGDDAALSVATDSAGRAAVGGSTASTDFPTTDGAAQSAYAGGTSDGFACIVTDN